MKPHVVTHTLTDTPRGYRSQLASAATLIRNCRWGRCFIKKHHDVMEIRSYLKDCLREVEDSLEAYSEEERQRND